MFTLYVKTFKNKLLDFKATLQLLLSAKNRKCHLDLLANFFSIHKMSSVLVILASLILDIISCLSLFSFRALQDRSSYHKCQYLVLTLYSGNRKYLQIWITLFSYDNVVSIFCIFLTQTLVSIPWYMGYHRLPAHRARRNKGTCSCPLQTEPEPCQYLSTRLQTDALINTSTWLLNYL